jgi:hypothetical protein
MTKLEALRDLLGKVKAGDDAHDLGLSFPQIGPTANQHANIAIWITQASSGSLDAAKALHEAVLPGWGFGVTNVDCDMGVAAFVSRPNNHDDGFEASNPCPARAWLIAIIEALIAEEQT